MKAKHTLNQLWVLLALIVCATFVSSNSLKASDTETVVESPPDYAPLPLIFSNDNYFYWPFLEGQTRHSSTRASMWHETPNDGIDFVEQDTTQSGVDNSVLAMAAGKIVSFCEKGKAATIKILHHESQLTDFNNPDSDVAEQNFSRQIDYVHLNPNTVPNYIKMHATSGHLRVVPGTYLGEYALGDIDVGSPCRQKAEQDDKAGHIHLNIPDVANSADKYGIMLGDWYLAHPSNCFINIVSSEQLCQSSTEHFRHSFTNRVDCDANVPYVGSSFCLKRTVVYAHDTFPIYEEPNDDKPVIGYVKQYGMGRTVSGEGIQNPQRDGDDGPLYWLVTFNQGDLIGASSDSATPDPTKHYWIREDDLREYSNTPFVDFQLGETHYEDVVALYSRRFYNGRHEEASFNEISASVRYFDPHDSQTFGQSALVAYRIRHNGNDLSDYTTDNSLQIHFANAENASADTSILIRNAANWLYDEGLLERVTYTTPTQGYSCTQDAPCFFPDLPIIRERAVSLFLNILKQNYCSDDQCDLGDGGICQKDGYTIDRFTDVPQSSAYFEDIMLACRLGVIGGYSQAGGICEQLGVEFPCFGPQQSATRAQWATIVARFYYKMCEGDGCINSGRFSSVAGFSASDELVAARERLFDAAGNPPQVFVFSNFLPSILYKTRPDSPPSQSPNSPTNLQANVIDTERIRLTWVDNSNNEDGFSIRRDSQTSYTNVAANTTSFVVNNLAPDTQYCFTVRAYNDDGASDWSNQVCATTNAGEPIPNKPTNLQVTAQGQSQIRLNWTDASSNELGFMVKQDNATSYPDVPANVTTFTASGLSAGTRYCYQVAAYNSSGVSDWSNQACTTTQSNPPAAPTNVQVQPLDANRMRVTWQDNSGNEEGFQIGTDIGTVGTVGANSTQFVVTGLEPNTRYCYHVRSYNSSGTSAWTDYACDYTDNLAFYYRDDFRDSSSGWPTSSNDPNFTIGYRSGEYYEITHNTANWYLGLVGIGVGNVDYSAKTNVRMADNSPVRYGLLFEWTSWENYLLFTVNPVSQSWRLERRSGSGFSTIAESNSSCIDMNQGWNTLEARVEGSTVTLLADGCSVYSSNVGLSGSAYVGLYSKPGTNTGVTSRFDYLEIEELNARNVEGRTSPENITVMPKIESGE